MQTALQTPPLYVGLDVSKAFLDVHCQGQSWQFTHDPSGCAEWLARLAALARPVHVILEATGGYERPVLAALRAGGVAHTLINPRQGRDFARASGCLAKTDRLDARLLAAFGAALTPAPTPVPSATQEALAAWQSRREQLQGDLQAESSRAQVPGLPKALQARLRASCRHLQKQLADCDRRLAALIASEAALAARAARLQSFQGVGAVTATALLAHLPELGHAGDRPLAALAGVAPFANDSGPRRGQRAIRGGRASVRAALYMAAFNAIRYNPVLAPFYERLRARGKSFKGALIAVARKLLCALNRALRDPSFVLLT